MSLELLAPAGSPEALDAAVGEGADAVYLGLKNFNARLRSANFTYARFEGALKALRRMGRKLYVTVNTVFEQREADRVYQLLRYLAGLGPDGLIVQDFGVAAMAKEFPSLRLHASTQMNIASARGANALSGYGLSRIVLARELGLEEIRGIRAGTNMELETFVHGALCVSASGLCLFSSYLGGKSANRGICTQACRRLYRSGDEEGYFFSPADLQLLERVPDLAAAGVNSLKIEGRMKSAGYVGAVVRAYRQVIDALGGTEEEMRRCIDRGKKILDGDFARAKTEFYFNTAAGEITAPEGTVSWLDPRQDGGTGISLGRILEVRGTGDTRRGLITEGRAVPGPGDTLRFHRADDSDRRSLRITTAAEGPVSQTVDEDGGTGAAGRTGAAGLWIPVPDGFGKGDGVYLIQTKAMAKRYAPLLSRQGEGTGRVPGRERAPQLAFPPFPAKPVPGTGKRGSGGTERNLPEGIYAQVSRIEDMYILQSARPERCLLNYSRKTVSALLAGGKGPLPFKPAEIVLVLDPFFPQAAEGTMAEEIAGLMERGYHQFVVNNPGHFSLFRPRHPVLIAGPYLYVFNRWAASVVASLGADYFISPLENNRQNLEKTVSPEGRSRAFITVFARPALFRIRADLGGMYGFREFTDGRGEAFSLYSGRESSLVLPRQPFSITDKLPFLREAGFGRFILDLSAGTAGPPLKKQEYRDLSKAVKEAAPLPGASRFNWKNGFYQEADRGEQADAR